jgi:two-component system, LytTR family, sensor kinase
MDNDPPAPSLRSELPLGAASAAGFWAFYFVTIAIRTALIDQDYEWLVYRGLGCLVGLALTFLVWLVLNRAAQESLRIQVIAAAIACIPAAAIFSTFNLAFAVQQPLVARTVVTEHNGQRTILTGRTAAERPLPPPPVLSSAIVNEIQRRRTIRLIADGLVTWYFFFAAWASFYIAISGGARLRAAERRAARAERDAQAAQLRALRYQVNPHFLFNTLNSLSSLVMARREEEAESMIVNLSTFFRSSLALDPSADVTLADEIEFQKLYLDIEKVRFPRRLAARFDIPDDLRAARVPPLLLQPLVENAIKHGVARTTEPVTLTLSAREEDARLILTVENDRGPAPGSDSPEGTGVGLANVCERLAARFAGAADCEAGPLPGGGYRVTLSMPLESDG